MMKRVMGLLWSWCWKSSCLYLTQFIEQMAAIGSCCHLEDNVWLTERSTRGTIWWLTCRQSFILDRHLINSPRHWGMKYHSQHTVYNVSFVPVPYCGGRHCHLHCRLRRKSTNRHPALRRYEQFMFCRYSPNILFIYLDDSFLTMSLQCT